MRGKSELVKPDTHNQTKGGLERDYITQWSYGIGETFSLLVPNVKGGASVPLAANEKTYSGDYLMKVGINAFTTNQAFSRVIELTAE